MTDLVYSSDVNKFRWRDQKLPQAFERWHFDALSDDGREAVVITFHDNHFLSPRYFRQNVRPNGTQAEMPAKFPAVSFTYWSNGKMLIRTLSEFESYEFSASNEDLGCNIGDSSFRMSTASYGTGFVVHIDLITTRKRRIRAEFEWLSVEPDLFRTGTSDQRTSFASWNMAIPRSDVSGRITLEDRHGRAKNQTHFRGTGYCDHVQSDRPVSGFHYWGRAHFSDATVVFHYNEAPEKGVNARLFLIRDGQIDRSDATPSGRTIDRSKFAARPPQLLSLVSSDGNELCIEPISVIEKSSFESRLLSEVTLTSSDGIKRKTFGIADLVSPDLMRSRLLRWLSDRRIGTHGKGPLY